MASSFVIEDPLDVEDILSTTIATDHAEVNGASVIHAHVMLITKSNLIDALLTLNDALSQTWIVGSGASFHVTPLKECFATFHASNHGHVYLGNNHAYSLKLLAHCIS